MAEYLELVEGSFTVEHEQKAQEWPYVAYSIKDDKVIYTIIPNEEGTMYTIYRVVSKDISNCTYNMVDLGLSVKWADRNVGATSPEHYGSYFQWGDTNAYTFDGVGEVTAAEMASLLQPIVGDAMEVTKDNVGDVLSMLFGGSDFGTDLTNTPVGGLGCSLDKVFNWDTYEVDEITSWGNDGDYRYPATFIKYNNNGSRTVLESVDDTATTHMGSQYRMPTIDEIKELVNNTTQTFIDLDGNGYDSEQFKNGAIEYGKLKGVRFTGSNGNSIFIPATGQCSDSLLYGVGEHCELWSSSLEMNNNYTACDLRFDIEGVYWDIERRGNGLPVRGVQA